MNIRALYSVPRSDEQEPQKLLIGNWLPLGTVGLITAAPNVGKTAIALALSESVEVGSKFFSHDVVNKAKAIFIEFDMNKSIFKDYNDLFAPNVDIGVIQGEKYISLDDGNIIHNRLDLTNHDDCTQLMAMCKELGVEVIIIDSLSTAFYSYDENSNDQMTKALTELKMIAEQGFAIIVLHHTAKASNKYVHIPRGASSIVACVDYHIELTATGKLEQSDLVTAYLAKTRHTSRKKLFSFYINDKGIHEYASPTSIKERIIEFFIESGVMTHSLTDIKNSVTGKGATIGNTCIEMMEAGILTRAPLAKETSPHIYTLVVEDNEVSQKE